MKPQYLLSVCQAHGAHYDRKLILKEKEVHLKNNEVVTLDKFCALVSEKCSDCELLLDGYFLGYSIPQIGNEFDLLRFGTNYNINIELKGKLEEETKIEIIATQMRKQHYYLKFLEKPLDIYTYIEDDGMYYYDVNEDAVKRVDTQVLIDSLLNQQVDFSSDPDKLFRPSNYLVSPFNKVERFISGEYFLTTDQAKKKREILNSIENKTNLFFCISAEAGTGKTLLTYDIAKTYHQQGNNVLVLHCANLNEGQYKLISDYGWNIKSVSALRCPDISCVVGEFCLIVVDEAHRMWKKQLDELITYAHDNQICVIFSYDTKQYFRDTETKEIQSILKEKYPDKVDRLRKLTTKIRTNKKMASFIQNMKEIGSSKDNLDYEDITVEYFSSSDDAGRYLRYLESSGDWKAITFTASKYSLEPVDELSCICEEKAHGVIGQEFDRVAFAMDSNFRYAENNKLTVRRNYYSLKGMLHQIVTRAVNELKIIVIDNPELYEKLMSIKYMGK